MASLKEIAQAANVSVPLVSKVLNDRLGSTRARPETIQAIRSAAERLGYQRNAAATALRTGRQHAVAVYVRRQGALASSLVEGTLDGISGACEEVGLRQNLAFYSSTAQFLKMSPRIAASSVDGLVVAGFTSLELANDLLAIQKRGVPVVTIFHTAIHPQIVNIGNNGSETGLMGTAHLVEIGCRRIAHISAAPDARGLLEKRHDGYRQALDEAGLPYDEALMRDQPGFDCQSGVNAVHRMIDEGLEFDGIFCDSDTLAMGAIRALFEHQRSVPDDVKVVGVDNSPYCQFGLVTLTSVSTRMRERGQMAVKVLQDIIDGKPAESRDVQPKLYARESTGFTGEA